MDSVYKVCIPNTHHDFFDYSGGGLAPIIGARVSVPFRQQNRLGFIVGKGASKVGLNLKTIDAVIDEEAFLSEDLLKLFFWLSTYYQAPLSQVLNLALPKKIRLGAPLKLPETKFYQRLMPLQDAKQCLSLRAYKQQALLDSLAGIDAPVSKQRLIQMGFNSRQIEIFLDKQILGLCAEKTITRDLSKPLVLNAEQTEAVSSVLEVLNQFRCFLLQGVTGSGKTEVYLQIIAKILAQGGQVLVLVPEIGLTPQLLTRFTERFHESIVVSHSELNEQERQNAWFMAFENKTSLVIGTRSAVFMPMPKLALIIIDEEHDASLKQVEGVRYSARDAALMRAYQAKIPIILGSATPSLESLYNCQNQKYSRLCLNHRAQATSPLHYQLMDLRSKTLKGGLCQQSLNLIRTHLDEDNQVLVFINRRGFAPVLLCHDCAWMADCRACDSHLTWHRRSNQMICHHCGMVKNPPKICPSCRGTVFIPVGTGTQRVQEILNQEFPNTEVLRVDRDEVSKKNSLTKHLERISRLEAKLIVGTQMLAKGHHFPRLSLVVVLDADAGLYNQDFRALENLGQLLTQVSGRAGRAEHPGQVLIQTHLPNHPMLNLLIQEGYEAFAKALLSGRQAAQLPPFSFLALIRAQSHQQTAALQFLEACKLALKPHPLSLFGPAPAPMPRKANQHRLQLLVKSSSRASLNIALTEACESLRRSKLSRGVRWSVDVDPLDLS